MRHRFSVNPLSVLIVIGMLGGVACRQPMNPMASEGDIEMRLRARTPVGTSRTDVEQLIRKWRWPVHVVDMRGYENAGYPTTIPASSALVADAAAYYAPLKVDVQVVYAFDDHDRLIGIQVHKYTDAP